MCEVVWKQPKERIEENEYEKWTKGICEDIVDKAIRNGSSDNLSCVFIAFKHYFSMLNKQRAVSARENVSKLKRDNVLIDSVVDIKNDVSDEYENAFEQTVRRSNSSDAKQQQHVFKSYYSQFNSVDPKKTSLENYYGV